MHSNVQKIPSSSMKKISKTIINPVNQVGLRVLEPTMAFKISPVYKILCWIPMLLTASQLFPIQFACHFLILMAGFLETIL